MIFGNPSEFAVQVEFIPEWSNTTYKNGCFSIYVNRLRLGIEFATNEVLTLQTNDLLAAIKHSKALPLPSSLSELDDLSKLTELVHLTYPDNADTADNCWDYVLSPDALTDHSFHLFCYRKGDDVFLLGGNVERGLVANIRVDFSVCKAIATQAHEYVKNL
jgi:hypothetical protein